MRYFVVDWVTLFWLVGFEGNTETLSIGSFFLFWADRIWVGGVDWFGFGIWI